MEPPVLAALLFARSAGDPVAGDELFPLPPGRGAL